MHLVLVPGLLIAMAAALISAPAQPAVDPLHAGGIEASSLFSVAAQATTTSTLTTTVATATTDNAATATTTLTGTSEVTATATLTGSVQSTPVPLPVQGGSVPLQGNPLDPSHLFSAASPPIGPYAWAFLALMTALLAASGYFMLVKRPKWKGTNSVLYRAANRWGPVGLWIAIPGIFFLLFRVVGLDFFNMRFWLYLWTLATLAAAGWFFYWYRTRYPKEVAKYQKTQRARQYMPGAASKSTARQTAQTKSKAVVDPTSGTESTTATTSVPPAIQARPKQKSNRRSKRK